MKNLIFGLSLAAIASISVKAQANTTEKDMQQNCYFDPVHSTSSCCFVSYCDIEYKGTSIFGKKIVWTAPKIVGFQQGVSITDTAPDCMQTMSGEFTSQAKCQAIFDALPNKCGVTKFMESGDNTRSPVLNIIPDRRKLMTEETKSYYLSELANEFDQENYEEAFSVALEMPFTFSEYQIYFLDKTPKATPGFNFNRSGFVLEPDLNTDPDDIIDELNNLNNHSICNLKKNKETTQLINRLASQNMLLNFPEDFR